MSPSLDHAAEGYRWSELRPADADRVDALHRLCCASMPRPDLVKPERPGFFHAVLQGRGIGVGAWFGDELIAFGLLITDVPPDHPYRPIARPEDGRVAKLHGSGVAPEHRSRGLHKRLIRARMAAGEAIGLDAVYSTAHPDNVGSLSNLTGAGLRVRAIGPLYGGLLRLSLRWGRFDGSVGRAERRVALADWDGITEALRSDLVGCAVQRDGDAPPVLVFARETVAGRGDEVARHATGLV